MYPSHRGTLPCLPSGHAQLLTLTVPLAGLRRLTCPSGPSVIALCPRHPFAPCPSPESSLNAAARMIHLKLGAATESDLASSSVHDLALVLTFSREKSEVLWWLTRSHNIPSIATTCLFSPPSPHSALGSIASWLPLSHARHILPHGFALADPPSWNVPCRHLHGFLPLQALIKRPFLSEAHLIHLLTF